jgi:hypothetical protein
VVDLNRRMDRMSTFVVTIWRRSFFFFLEEEELLNLLFIISRSYEELINGSSMHG